MTRKWSVTEATEFVAFLSDEDGHDVATLHRLRNEQHQSHTPLSGDDWQAMVDLVAASPQWAAAIRHIASQPYTSQAADLIDYARQSIVRAEREGKK